MACCLTGSHRRTVPSEAPLTSSLPSGLNARLLTHPVWPLSGSPTGCLVAGAHSRMVRAPLLALARSLPSGLNATLVTRPAALR
jgi:hypothetical protein